MPRDCCATLESQPHLDICEFFKPAPKDKVESCCTSEHGHDHGHAHEHEHKHKHAAHAGHTPQPVSASSCETTGKGSACGCSGNPVFDGVDPRYKLVLWVVIGLNGLMFLVEMLAGHLAGSQALKADALDFLGDTLTYGVSLAVIGMPMKVRSTAALLKGISLLGMGGWVLVTTLLAMMGSGVPAAPVMGGVAIAALAANLASVLLLAKWKDGDANVRSVWLCSRNDAIGNVAVMAAALGVWGASSGWPDLIVALGMAGLFLSSAISILRQSVAEYRAA